jgi:hypothetical protein
VRGRPRPQHMGHVIGAISIAGPRFRIAGAHPRAFHDEVMRVARDFSNALGYGRLPPAQLADQGFSRETLLGSPLPQCLTIGLEFFSPVEALGIMKDAYDLQSP